MGRKKIYSTELYNECKKIFSEFYMKYFNIKFYWDIKQTCQLGEVITRIILQITNEIPGAAYNDADVIKAWKYILNNMDDTGFIWKNLKITMIVIYWNDILKQCRANYRKSVVKTEDEISNQYKAKAAPRIETGTFKDASGAVLKAPTDITELLKEIIKL